VIHFGDLRFIDRSRSAIINCPSTSMSREVSAKPLTHSSISKASLQLITVPSSPSAAKQGNQGTALVARKLTSFPSSYNSAPSGKSSSCNTAYFRCAPRPVFQDNRGRTRLAIKVFERHPFTRQAFFPMGTDTRQRAYVVVVAEDKSSANFVGR
jgi:ureidoglycolate hydrolase